MSESLFLLRRDRLRKLPWDLGGIVARLIVGGIFLMAAVPKIQSAGHFADAVRTYHLLPPELVLPFAFFVPWVELLIALYLLSGFMTRLAAGGSTVLLAMFSYALLDSIFTGNIAHACGCFGSGEQNPVVAFLTGGNSITWWDPARDLILLALSLLLIRLGGGALSIDRWRR